jgi:hypothetical protein
LLFTQLALSTYFLENDGLYPDSIKYYAQGQNVIYYISKNSIIQQQFEQDKINDSLLTIKSKTDVLTLINSNGLNDSQHILLNNVKKISKGYISQAINEITFVNVYNGIDQRFYFENNKLRFDFIVKPGANPDQIALTSSENLMSDNDNITSDNFGLKNLYTYQKEDKKEVFSKFSQINGIITFEIGTYDPTQKLIIDPLMYSSYIGGLDIDSGEDIAVAEDGSIVVVGETASPNFPTTLGSYQREITLGEGITSDIFVTKVDINYNHIFTTYIGSSGDDFGRGVDLDSEGNIYITGYTRNSDNFPTTANTYDQSYNGFNDAFLIKMNPDGDSLIASTFLGGNRDDFALSVKVMQDTSVVVTGYTTIAPDSAAFPATPDAFNEIYAGNIDGFITRFNKEINDIIWSAYLGGLNDDFPQDLAIGRDSTIYVAGLTRSQNFPTTDGVLYREYNDNNNSPQHSDAFVTQISNDGREMLLSTVFGGTNGDIAYGLKVDNQGNIYIAGETRSSDLPTAEFAPNREINKGNDQVFTPDAFYAKFSPLADELLAGSYLGGESTERAFDIGIDALKNVYMVGTTSSQNFPISEFAYDKKLNDSVKYSDIFITMFNSRGDSINYSSYFGADRSDLAKAMQVRSQNRIVFTGNTSSTFLETTNDAIQVSYQDSLKADAHFAEFFLDDFDDADIFLCSGGSTTLNSDITSTTTTLFYKWSPEESLDDSDKEFPVATPEISTLYTCVVSNTFGEKFIAQVLVAVIGSFQTSISGQTEVENDTEYLYSTISKAGSNYNWTAANGTIVSGQGTNNVLVTWQDAEFGSLRLIETNSFGCKDTATIFTSFSPKLPWEVYPFGDYIFCEGDTILLDSGPGFTQVIWQDGWEGRYDTVYTSGVYSFTGRRSNGTIYNSPEATIKFLERPRKPTIIFSDKSNQLVCISAAENYYWFLNEEIIPGQNTRFLDPIGPGCYQVSIENLDSCVNRSDDFCIGTNVALIEENSKIYPNPSEGIVNLDLQSKYLNNSLMIYNSIGKEVYSQRFNYHYLSELNLSIYGRGIYYILINGSFYKKVVIY